ncbi:MAG TPA: hypothetical protein VIY52_33340 [Streptosporangiaceae bacterium]
MVLISISSAGLPDTSPLVLFRYHAGKIVPQVFRHDGIWRDFPDSTLKRTAALAAVVPVRGCG